MDELFSLVRELAAPAVWSAGVELARNSDFEEQESLDSQERCWRILGGRNDRPLRVSLSEDTNLWSCDCGLAEDPCRHVVATVLAVRQGKGSARKVRPSTSIPAAVIHCLSRQGKYLSFSRQLETTLGREPVVGSLARSIAEIGQKGHSVSVNEAEERLDIILAGHYSGVLEPRLMRLLMPALSRVGQVELDGVRAKVGRDSIVVGVEVVDERGGFRLRREFSASVDETFDNGVCVSGGALHALEDSGLSGEDLELLRGEGAWFGPERGMELATRLVPRLRGRVKVSMKSAALPRVRKITPRVVIQTIASDDGQSLTVIPQIAYGDPAVAFVERGALRLIDPREVPIRDDVEEARLMRDMTVRLGLRMESARTFHGEAAVGFAQRLRDWDTSGAGRAAFLPASRLLPFVSAGPQVFEVAFRTETGGEVGARELLAAYRRGSSVVGLATGGWATVPREWLAAHAVALQRIVDAREEGVSAAARLLPDIEELCDALDVNYPEYFSRLKSALEHVEQIPTAQLPRDLQASLRPYQITGVNWLAFCRDNGLGALLADDMGLGKTLQAISVLQGRSLIVCPTSVLSSWSQQLRAFRPSLQVDVYHGPGRSLANSFDVVLTSYAVMRLDIALLRDSHWDTIVLDEAQTIRNPESQVAQAAYRLQGDFRICLSGTPVENSLDDLWSQFHFLNPGLLGSRPEFSTSFADPIAAGDVHATDGLRRRVTPFILRRLKRDVAHELPPKTELVLECELTREERTVYEAIAGTARREVSDMFARNESMASVLEVLLRLRQTCCCLGLLPGYEDSSSSKIELLLERLLASRAQGHKALVFSQWTSLLDLIEKIVAQHGISFARIDGSTEERGAIVNEFQSESGPDVLLLSLKAGGLGLTLTRADHVYIVDPWWNPAAEDQAADRAYRIGQTNPVFVHRLVARDTIEERILSLQEHKRSLLSAAIGGAAVQGLTRDEILDLIA